MRWKLLGSRPKLPKAVGFAATAFTVMFGGAFVFMHAEARRSVEDVQTVELQALKTIVGRYWTSQENCGLEPEMEISPTSFRAETDGFKWSSLEYDEAGFFSTVRSDPEAPSRDKRMIIAASHQKDGTTIVSVFMPLTSADMEWSGMGSEVNRSADQPAVVLYAAYSVEGWVDLSQKQPSMKSPEDSALLVSCVSS